MSFVFAFSQTTPLPNYSTAQEKAQLQFYVPSRNVGIQSPPPGTGLRTAAEWEEMRGTVVAWEGYNDFISEIVKYAQEEGMVYIFTGDSNSTRSTLQSNGVSLTNVRCLNQNLNSVWIRDYGANNVYIDSVGDLVFVDWIYNRNRPADDASPDYLANYLSLPIYSSTNPPTDLVNTGGNFMSDGQGNAFASMLVMDENESTSSYNQTPKTEAEVNTIMEDYMGIQSYRKMTDLPYDGIHHIDMHIKLLDEQTLLVGEYPSGVADGPQIEQNLQYILDNFQTCFGTDYKVVRIPMPPEVWSGNDYYPDNGGAYLTYTNSLIINKSVLVPIYLNEEYDTTAIRIYEETMPGYNVIGIDAGDPIQASGAIHCTSHEIGIDNPLLIVHLPLEDQVYNATHYTVKANIQHRDGISWAKVYYSLNNNTSYQSVDMSNTTGNFWSADIPQQSPGTKIYYYVEAQATSGKEQVRPMPAPDGYWMFKILLATDITNQISEKINIKYYNQNNNLNIYFTSQESHDIQIDLYNQMGTKLSTIVNGRCQHGVNQYSINTSNYATGIYFVRMKYGNQIFSEKVLIK
jgi:agmatine/peptidylarginine deiminase